MQGDIDEAMCNGIVESEIYAAFITERYLLKVTGENDMDNCKKEFIFAKQKLGPQRMVCIVMEKQCRDTSLWPGQIGMYCGSRLYIDFSDDLNFDEKIHQLADHFLDKIRATSQQDPSVSLAQPSGPEDLNVIKFTQQVHELQEEGDINNILAHMRRLLSHRIVQQLGCAALKQIAHDTENQILIFGAGGIQDVINAMRKHKEHAGVQDAGCGVLCNVGVVAGHKEGIAKCGGVGVVLDALREHPKHSAVQKQGLSALRVLAVNEQIALNIASADGIQVVVGAMRTHPANVKVQQRACRALLQIGLSDAGVQRRMKEAGVVALVEAAVRAPNATSKCRDKGQELLRLFT